MHFYRNDKLLAIFFHFGPGIFKLDHPVKYKVFSRRILVGREIPDAFELDLFAGQGTGSAWFNEGPDSLKRVGVEVILVCLSFFCVVGVLFEEKAVVKSHFGGNGMGCRNPVECSLDLPVAVRHAAPRGEGVAGSEGNVSAGWP